MPIKEGMTQLANATGEALRGIRKASGMTTDRELMQYNSFKPEDFDAMSQMYGHDSVLEYIREMELRRLTPIK